MGTHFHWLNIVAILEMFHQRRFQKKLTQHVVIRHAGWAFAVKFNIVERRLALAIGHKKAIEPGGGNVGFIAGGQADQLLFVAVQVELGAQFFFCQQRLGQLAKNL